MEPIPEVDLIPLMELIPIVEPIPFIDMIPTLMIPIPTYPHCSKGDSDSDSKNNWNHNTSNMYIGQIWQSRNHCSIGKACPLNDRISTTASLALVGHISSAAAVAAPSPRYNPRP